MSPAPGSWDAYAAGRAAQGPAPPDAWAPQPGDRAGVGRGASPPRWLQQVAIAPPPIAELEPGGEAYGRANRMALRNTTIGNQPAACAITLPCGQDDNGLPIGLMLQSAPHTEEKLLALALGLERLLA